MDKLTQQLLEAYQRGLPLSVAPYAEMAQALGTDEATIIGKLQQLQKQGVITRVGPVFNHRKAGASTLVAMSVPPHQLTEVVKLVNSYTGVNHNYEREHNFNLWFVVTAPDQNELESVLAEIEARTQLPLLNLPMESAYHIDLGFALT